MGGWGVAGGKSMKAFMFFTATAAWLSAAPTALAEAPPGDPSPYSAFVYASSRMVQSPHGRSAILGVAPPVAAEQVFEPRSAVLDCSTDARQEGEMTTPYACLALPQWPSSGTPFSIEDENRRRFEGQ